MKTKTDYSTLDKAIYTAAYLGRHPLYFIGSREEADRIAAATGRDSFRIIDARMRALVKDGKIVYDKAARAWKAIK